MIHVVNVLKVMFSWPFGIVLGNLIASGITGTLTVIWTHFKLKKHHAKIMEGLNK